MLLMYLGYLIGQFYFALQVIYSTGIPPLMIFFSVVVLMTWSLFPVLGYGLGKYIRDKLTGYIRQDNKYLVFAIGLGMSLLERLSYDLKILTDIDGYLGDGYIGISIFTAIFFVIAFLPLDKSVKNQEPATL